MGPSKNSSYPAVFKCLELELQSQHLLIYHASWREAIIGKDARLGFEPGTARHEAKWGIQMQLGGALEGGIQEFEAMGAHSACPPFLRFIVDGKGQRLWCPSSPGAREHTGSSSPLLLRGVSSVIK